MRNLIIILTLITTICSCSQNKKNDVKLLDSFLRNIVLNKNYSDSGLLKYFSVEESNTEIINLLKFQVEFLKNALKDNQNDYKIISHAELSKYKLSSNLEYKNYNEVFYLLSNKEIIAPLIIEGDKLISISFGIYKTESQKNKHPMIINNL